VLSLKLGDTRMTKPPGMTLTMELTADWKRILKKLNPIYLGFIANLTPKYFELTSSNFKFPILNIQHPDHAVLNNMPDFLFNLTSTINKQCVNKIGGIRFIPPIQDKYNRVLHDIIDMFDAEVKDIIVDGVQRCQD
jgi:hypothetical protein